MTITKLKQERFFYNSVLYNQNQDLKEYRKRLKSCITIQSINYYLEKIEHCKNIIEKNTKILLSLLER